MNSPDCNIKPGKKPNRRAKAFVIFVVSLSTLALIASFAGSESGRKEAERRELDDKKAREQSPRVTMPRLPSNDPKQWTIFEYNDPAPDPQSTYKLPKSPTITEQFEDEYFKGIPALEERKRSDAIKEQSNRQISLTQFINFFGTWYNESGEGKAALEIWQKGAVLSRPKNGHNATPLQRDWAAAFFILLDQSIHAGNEANASALGSEVFSLGLRPPEIMMFAAIKTSASIEKDFDSVEVENADQKFTEISRSLTVWESALKIASEGSYSYVTSEGAGEAFYKKQLENYQATLRNFEAALSSFKKSGQKSDLTEAKITANEVLQVLANPLLTWRASDDREIQAKFIKIEAKAVVIEKEDGKQYTVPFANLASTSIEMAKRLEHIHSLVRTGRTPSQ